MFSPIKIDVLTKDVTQSVKNKITEIDSSGEDIKELKIELNDTTGNFEDVIGIIDAINTSGVDLICHANGKLGAAGVVLLSAGKPGRRTSEMGTVLVLNDEEPEKFGRFKRVKNPAAGLISHLLCTTTGKKAPVRNAVDSMNILTAYDGLKLGIVDEVVGITTKYEDLLKPKKKGEKEKAAESETATTTA